MITPCLNFHNCKTVIQGSLRTKIMPWDAWLASGKHSINSCYSTTKGIWEQWGETSVSPECCELNCTHHRVPPGALEQRNYWGQPGLTQVNLRPGFVECTNPCDYWQSICIDGERAWMSTEAGREKYKIKENSEGRNKRTLPAKAWSKKEKEDLKNTYKTSKTSRCLATHFFFFYPLNSQNYSLDKSLEECGICPWPIRHPVLCLHRPFPTQWAPCQCKEWEDAT